eukprot:2641877-Prorocentrum_lima.AAC.1
MLLLLGGERFSKGQTQHFLAAGRDATIHIHTTTHRTRRTVDRYRCIRQHSRQSMVEAHEAQCGRGAREG